MLTERLMEVEMWSIDKPIPYEKNARVLSPYAVSKVAASIKEFGFKQPIVVDGDDVVVAGHTRLLAAKQLGMEEVPVVVANDLSEAQIKAYRLADNRTAQETSWDYELLGAEFEDMRADNFDASLTGFEDDEIPVTLSEYVEVVNSSGVSSLTHDAWIKVPVPQSPPRQETVFSIVVSFKTEADSEAFFSLLKCEKQRAFVWSMRKDV
jgi:hypothetical protein